jgi:predicted N-formylglutamate amidohydrolase
MTKPESQAGVYGLPVEVINPGGQGRVLLVCEHASNAVPPELEGLGLSDDLRRSHIAWDPGALPVAERMAARLDAALVAGRFSRLVHDCNRPPDSADAVLEVSEGHPIPGNRGLSPAQRAARAEVVHAPFHARLAAEIEARTTAERSPVIVTIHSFTPVYRGSARQVELGILHDADTRLADLLLAEAAALTGLVTRRNEPYGPADGVTHTLRRHALPGGLLNVMIELRNDLLSTAAARERIADALAEAVGRALERLAVEGTARSAPAGER